MPTCRISRTIPGRLTPMQSEGGVREKYKQWGEAQTVGGNRSNMCRIRISNTVKERQVPPPAMLHFDSMYESIIFAVLLFGHFAGR